MCDCDEDYDDRPDWEKYPKRYPQPKGLPGWAVARLERMLQPEYGPWIATKAMESIVTGRFMVCEMREMTRSGKPDGLQIRIRNEYRPIKIPQGLYK